MNADSDRLIELFGQAMQKKAGPERARFLSEACQGHPELFEQLKTLIQAHDEAGDFLQPTRVVTQLDPVEIPDQVIGRYKLLERVGEGGWGTVYVAEQQEPVRRRVALKIIKLGMDTKQVIARFRAEQQALALMDHPNIAKVLDAGATETGRPYFVMELVRGIRITDYCDQAQLSTKERLHLFIQVCQAIQHAHQKGIIHRDIKPSNILVTLHDGVPVPKVIDFGIAKATEGRLADATVYTQLHQFIGTPTYMSPEQAEMSGLDMDTRSDIYSLGVLLYELLTGRPPFNPEELMAAGLETMRRTIREKEPMRPSTRLANLPGEELTTTAKRRSAEAPKLVHQVRGDLDWIVMKCLEKDRTRRYETANGLANDIRRHLENEPVAARPPSAAYRFQKMARRNRAAFVGTVVVALALIVGFGAALVGYVQAVYAKAKESELRQQAQAQELASRRRAYAAEMNTAYRSFADNNLGHVLQILDRQRPKAGEEDLRGFEWRLLWQKARGNELMTFKGEGSGAFAYSPNGAYLAYGDKEIIIRDAKTKSLITKLPAAHWSLSFSPDSRLLASGSTTAVHIWDTESWKQVRSLPEAGSPAKFSPNGRWMVTGNPDGCCLWDTDTWAPVGLAPGGSKTLKAAFSPDSQYLLTASVGNYFAADRLRVWRIPSMEELAPIQTGDPILSGPPYAITFSADGERVIVGREHGQIMVWDFKTRNLLKTWNAHASIVKTIEISADGKWLVTGSGDHTIRLWDLATGEHVAQLGTHVGEVWGLAISPDGREVVAGSKFPPDIRIWSMSTHESEPRLLGEDQIYGMLDQGRLLVGNSTNDMAIWDPAKGTVVRLPIYGGFETTNTGKSAWKVLVALKPDNSIIAVGRRDGTIELWSPSSQSKVRAWQAHRNAIYALAYSPDGRTLVTGSERGEIQLWDSTTQARLGHFEHQESGIQCFAISPNGKFLACGADVGFRVWNLATHTDAFRSDCDGSFVSDLGFSPDGKLLAISAMHLIEVHLWDPEAESRVAVLKGLRGYSFGTCFSPDGRTLASVGLEVKFWNVPTLLEVASLGEEGVSPWQVWFLPDGLGLALAHGKRNKHISLWRAPSLAEIDRIESRK